MAKARKTKKGLSEYAEGFSDGYEAAQEDMRDAMKEMGQELIDFGTGIIED